jgi:hypothetical protein
VNLRLGKTFGFGKTAEPVRAGAAATGRQGGGDALAGAGNGGGRGGRGGGGGGRGGRRGGRGGAGGGGGGGAMFGWTKRTSRTT